MPWNIRKRGRKWCVVKAGETSPVPGGCHATRAEAVRHQRALYASEGQAAVVAAADGPDVSSLAMVAVYPRREEAAALAVDGGESADDLHCTLVFLGEADQIDAEMVTAAADLVASELAPLSGTVGGIGHFAEGENGTPVILLPDVQGLTLLRERVVDELAHRGIHSPSEHGFQPHITQMYMDSPDEIADSNGHIGAALHFDAISVVVAGKRTDYELRGARAATASAATPNALRRLLGLKEEVMAQNDFNTGTSSATTPTMMWTASSMLDDIKLVPVVEYGGPSGTDKLIGFELVQEDESDSPTWEGVLAVEGIVTSDGRYLMPGKIDWRDLPLTLMAQKVTDEGHKGAEVAGKITAIRREDRPDLGENAVAIIGTGVFADTDEGREAHQLLADEVLRGVSIDFAPTATHMLNAETLEEIDPDEMDIMELLSGDFVRGFEGDIMGATLCPFPAFEDATMQIVEAGDKVVVASAFPVLRVLTASAAGLAPLKPPYDWFFQPETNGPCPLTVTDDGLVYGHLALWNQCHRSLADHCEMAPRSRSGYAYFHTGAITTDDGRKVNVGRITVGDGGHASVSPYLGTKGAIEHYDKTGMVGAFVRAVDGIYGIWLSGCVRSDAPAEKIRDLEANPPSGDWREEKGRLELCAALSVPVAGFPVPRYEAALVASGSDERVVALIASGYMEPGKFTRSELRRVEVLKTEARAALSPISIDMTAWAENGDWLGELESEDFARITAEDRRKAASSGAALPDGSFPITKCRGEGSSAENAIRAQGRADPGKRGRVRAHIRKRVRALGCSGGIFDPYR